MTDMHKGTCFCGAVEVEPRARPWTWAIATANPAAPGPARR